MRHNQLLKMFAWLAMLSIGLFGEAFAQVPSLVTQQTRLSTGGGTPSYVQLRAKAGIAASPNFYSWDQAPTPTAGTNYSLFLDANNNIERSDPFTIAQKNFLMAVNATGDGLQWIDPASITTLDGDIKGPANANLVNVGQTGLDNRLILGINNATGYTPGTFIAIDRGGTNSNAIPTAGTIAYGDGTAYQFNAVGTTGQILQSTGAGIPIWVNSPSLLTFDNALTKTADNVQFGGPLVKATSVDQATFAMTFSNGTLNLGAIGGASAYNINVDVGAAGNMTMKNIVVDATAPNILAIDATGNVRTRSFSTLVSTDNGLTNVGSLISFGAPATNTNPFLTDRFVTMGGKTLTFDGSGNYNIGDGAGTIGIKLDPGAAGAIQMKNVANFASPTATDRFVMLDPTGAAGDKVFTRTLSSLVLANNGLIVDNVATPGSSTVQLGAPATGGANILTDRFIGLNAHALNIEGSGSINLGDGAGTANIKLDPGAAGFITAKNVATLPTPTATDRFVVLETGTDHAYTRTLTSLVNANNGVIVDNVLTPGTSTVQLGAPATGGANILVDRFIGLNSKNLNFEGDGSVNVGTTGNANLNVNTGTTGNMKLEGTTLSAGAGTPGFNNMAFVDQATNNVRVAKTSDVTVNATPTMFITVDGTGNITKSVSPTTGFTKGQIAGTGTFTYTSPAINIAAGASITCTVENHTGINGTVLVQVTNVTTGAAGSFSVETSENVQAGSFINYVVMN